MKNMEKSEGTLLHDRWCPKCMGSIIEQELKDGKYVLICIQCPWKGDFKKMGKN